MTLRRWSPFGVGAVLACAACGQAAPDQVTGQSRSSVTRTTIDVGSQSQEACKVSNTAAGGSNDLSDDYAMSGADLGITVAYGARTWVLFGDTSPADARAWPAAADATGYFSGRNPPAGICGGVDLVSVSNLPSTPTLTARGSVYAPDPVFFTQPWPSVSISDFVFRPVGTPCDGTGSLPSNAAIPGPNEVPTGAFAYAGSVYTFYSGAPGGIGSGVPGDDGLASVSYLTSWAPPGDVAIRAAVPRPLATAVSVPFAAAESRQILSMVDYVGSRPPTPSWSARETLGGKFVQVAPVVSAPYLYLFGTGAYRKSHVSLARLPIPADDGPLAFSQYLSQTPGFEVWNGNAWSSAASDAAALAFADDTSADVGELSVQQFEPGGEWLMMYTPSWMAGHVGNVMMRWATSPSGPWSAMTSVLDFTSTASGAAYCCSGAPPGGCVGPELYACVDGTPVYGVYAPYMLPYLTPVAGTTYRVWYMISGTWPYTTALMSFTIHVTP